jgi:hypothetical protein
MKSMRCVKLSSKARSLIIENRSSFKMNGKKTE